MRVTPPIVRSSEPGPQAGTSMRVWDTTTTIGAVNSATVRCPDSGAHMPGGVQSGGFRRTRFPSSGSGTSRKP